MSVDANERSRNAPVCLRSETRYGRVLRLFQVELSPSFPLSTDHPELPRSLVLALVARAKPTKVDSQLGIPVCRRDALSTPVIVDVTSLEDLVGRVRDRGYCSFVQRSGNAAQMNGEGEYSIDDEGQ